jgi:hypothetical protein
MTTRLETNKQFGPLFMILFIAMLIYSATSEAQSFRNKIDRADYYKGFEFSFGVRSFSVRSNFEEINGLSVVNEGSRAGIIVGNNSVKARVGIGLFYSASSVCRTFQLFEGDAAINLYPVKKGRIAPYLTTGLVFGKNRLFGNYATNDGGRRNSSSGELYIGSANQVRASVGAGLEYKLIDSYNFVHLYSEARYGFSVLQNTSNALLSETTTGKQLMISMGVRFGAFR